MKFGPVALDDAEGAVTVHALSLPDLMVRKGTRLDAGLIERLRAAGHGEIIAVRAEPGDVWEDEAASRVAASVLGPHAVADAAFTGRVNIRAAVSGLLTVDRAGIDALNMVDEAVTLATLPAFRAVRAGEMIATVKIIPFAVPGNVLERIAALAGPLVRIAPYRLRKVALVSTLLPGLGEKVLAKTARTTAARLAPTGASLIGEQRVPHAPAAVAQAVRAAIGQGAELVLVFGASAIADRRDVIPAGIEAAGGMIEHFGMPVDPGNLLLLGRVGSVRVLGAPGCARSPKENGFDWVLRRLLAGLDVSRSDIMSMGVGGLLMEIPTRPQPREEEMAGSGSTGVVLLAAGRGTRMNGVNKMSALLDGEPLVRRAACSALAARTGPVVVVTGHEAEPVTAALEGLDVIVVHNPTFADGLSTSLKAGIAALPEDVASVVVMLGDMPKVGAELIEKLAAALDPEAGLLVAVPVREGKRGNPVALSRRLFPAILALSGDIGARQIIAENPDAVIEVAVEDEGAFTDIDTREELEALQIHTIAARADVDASAALDGMEAEDA
ncbi:molybdopterin-binding/glycosyltransferase family 2 protein [Ancylobacter sp. A5.8]|uniref:NTP transferase domain-containing protein n=1 Tax=Ancylobacter gelatini TaxID=2919920 RepID=UPI001F4E739E|nr:molybdopterin-binding/glycosyltransferase family 2 protein [Ancylobacter gelatini]MCJ8142922.1 molybdopterin-binding/glycosyltransferase family 2 protein [Ancylobacter gelatini]